MTNRAEAKENEWPDSPRGENVTRPEAGRERGLGESGSSPESGKSEGRLAELESTCSAFLEAAAKAGEGVVLLQDTAGKEAVCVFSNEAAAQITGYSRHELARLSWSELLHPSYREMGLSHYRRRIHGEQFRSLSEIVIRKKSGEEVPVEITASCLEFDGKPGVICFFRDITASWLSKITLLRNEDEIKRLNKENSLLAKIGRIISSTIDIDEVYEQFAGASQELIPFDRIIISLHNLGLDTATILHLSGVEVDGRKKNDVIPLKGSVDERIRQTGSGVLVHPDSVDELEHEFPALVSSFHAGLRSMISVPLISRGQVIGGLHLRSLKPKAYTDRDLKMAERIADQISGAIANAQLFTALKQAEEGLRGERDKAQKYLDVAGVILVAIEKNQEVSLINKMGCQVLGLKEEEIIGANWFEMFLPPSDRERVKAVFAMMMAGEVGPVEYFENPVLTKSGEEKIVAWRNSLLRDQAGNPIGTLSSGEDITERKRAEEALKRSEEEARLLAKENALVAEIGRIISSTFDIDKVYEQFTGVVQNLLPFDRIVVNLNNSSEGTIIASHVAGFEIEGIRKNDLVPLKGSVNERIAHTRSGMLVQPESAEELEGEFPSLVPAYRAGLLSMLSVPLISSGLVIGGLHLRSLRPKAYTEKDLKLAGRIADQIAGAISNALLYNETRRMEIELRKKERRYRLLDENLTDIIFTMDLNLRFTDISSSVTKMTGYTPEEALTKSLEEYLTPPSYRTAVESYQRTLQAVKEGKEIAHRAPLDLELIRKDGTHIWVEITQSLLRDPDEEKVEILGVCRDITERRKKDGALRESERKFSELFHEAPVGYHELDREGRITDINRTELSMLGYTLEEMSGQPVWQFMMDGEIYREVFLNKIAGKLSPYTPLEHVYRKKDGKKMPVSLQERLIYDEGGKVAGVRSNLQDMTEREKTQEDLRKLFRAVEQGPTAVIISGPQGHIEYVNSKFTEITGYSKREVWGRTLEPLILALPSTEEGEVLRNRVDAGQEWKGVFYTRRKNGVFYWAEVSVSPLKDALGKISNFVWTMNDITPAKEFEEALEKARAEADAANKAKSEFLSTMSHEIRTPMNSIIGMSDLLWESPMTPDQRQYLEVIRSSGETLLNLINDVLDISKVEAGMIELRKEEFALPEVIENTLEMMAPRAHGKGLELISHIPAGVPARIVGDPHRLRQILINLIGNAVKFTEKGEIFLTVAKEVMPVELDEIQGQGKDCLQFSVVDTGIGIPRDKLAVIFNPFIQADPSVTRKYGGSGLGLSICKRMVELMEGRILVESEVGKGSTFSFCIPLEESPTGNPRETNEADWRGLKVLIGDKSAFVRMALKEMLTRWGALVEEAENGENCLFHLRHGKENGAPFDLVLLDGQMAGTHEMELAKMIEENLHLAGQIILMTRAGNHQGEMAGAKRAGIRHYLVKPIKQSELRKAIESSRSRGETLAGVQPEPPLISSDTAVQLHILLVEDSEENRLLIQNYLKKTTHRVDIAENGEIAVNKFKSGSYDLVLMDMQMPVMDGYTATRKIRMWEREMGGESRKHTPIVALTAFALQEEAKKSLEAGCDAHLTKPIKRATLLKVLSEYSPQSPSLAPNPAGGRI